MALDKFQPYLFVSAGEQSNKYLTPVISPEGIASFQAQRAQELTGLTVRIDPIQEGTGDPSPTNVRPISGRTGMTVTRAGKNLANFVDGYGVDTSGNVTPLAKRTATIEPIIINENIRYRYSMSGSGACIYAVWKGDTLVRRISGIQSGSLLNTSGGDRFYICAYGSDADVTKDTYHPMVTVESADYATYEPYRGATYPITWETEAGTVYGGSLDVVSGVLTVTHAAVDMGTLNYTYDSSGGRFYTSVSGKKNESSDSEMMLAISSMYKPMTASEFQNNPTNGTMRGATIGGYVYFRNNEYTDSAPFKTAMAGQTLCYELATPQTYRLTGAEVRTIAGFNQIYSNVGPVIDIKF